MSEQSERSPKNPSHEKGADKAPWIALAILVAVAVGWYGWGAPSWLEYQRKQSDRAFIEECKRQAAALGISGSQSERVACRLTTTNGTNKEG
jgi:hypothetical protein